jgi:peptidyl-prolyl cis-trans isomerase B (cyclophilin B)
VWETAAARALCHSGGVPGPDTFPRPRPARLGLAWLALASLALAACSQSPSAAPAASASSAAGDSPPCTYTPAGEAAKPVEPPPTGDVETSGTVTYTLTFNGDAPRETGGNVTITMDRSKTPCTVNSFVSLAKQGYFDGTRCHRLADSGIFVLQCGDPAGDGSGGPGYTFGPLENVPKNGVYPAGTIAMARGTAEDSQGSQFFIVYKDSKLPAPGYTVFGKVTHGLSALKSAITSKGTANGSGDGAPKVATTLGTIAVR